MSRKRGQNEGTISQRKDGRWEARITTGYRSGKQVRKCIYGKTRDEVAGRMAEDLVKVRKGQELPHGKQTLKSFIESWLETTAKSRLRPRTYQRYKELIDIHIVPALGHHTLAKLSPQHVQQHLGALQLGGLSARTVLHVRAVLRVALNGALRYGLVYRNVACLVDPPKVESYRSKFLTDREALALLKAVRETPMEALVTLALTTGLRLGEILGLSWDDVDLPSQRITVRNQQQFVERQVVLMQPKTGRSARVLDLPEITVEALERHRLRQILEDRPTAGPEWQESGRVFTNQDGSPLKHWTALTRFHKLLGDADLPKMRLHDLRHSCATILLANGVHPRIVMEILGHSTIAMTMNIYSHALPSVMKDAASSMDRALSNRAE